MAERRLFEAGAPLAEQSDDEDPPVSPSDVGSSGGETRVTSRVTRPVSVTAIRRTVSRGIMHLRVLLVGCRHCGRGGDLRSDPDDASLSRSDSLIEPGKIIHQAARDSTPGSPSQGRGLGSAAEAASLADRVGDVPTIPACSPPVEADPSGSRRGGLPESHSNLECGSEPATRRIRTDLPTEAAEMAPLPSVLRVEDRGFRNRYALRLLPPSPTQLAQVCRRYDLEAAVHNPMGSWPGHHHSFLTGDPNRLPP